MKAFLAISLLSVILLETGCGVKSKPLAPLKEPWISTGDIEKDKEKKAKTKRPTAPTDSRVEFSPPPTMEEKKEL
ncbi:MAG: hypothetical protein JNM24_18225 [Bdellovibrionaceae bacterium]|nr:hypothetical protein [Pseudobdellovibrionaceae bacterium]